MSESRRRGQWLLGGLVIVCVVTVAAVWRFRRAKVTGDTAEQRIASVIRIADDKPRGYAEVLADTARNDPDEAVRSIAVASLHGSPGPIARDAIDAGTQDENSKVRKSACISLMARNDQAAVDRLTEICRDDVDKDVRHTAFVALAANKSPYATVALMDMMENGATPELCLEAAWAMGDLANMRVVPNPEELVKWADMIEGLKMSTIVQATYDQTNTPLIHDQVAQERIFESLRAEHSLHHNHGTNPTP